MRLLHSRYRASARLNFNPRTPYGVRPLSGKVCEPSSKFQSTHPVWGATLAKMRLVDFLIISIHAPRMGCDKIRRPCGARRKNFNPRTPYGVRLPYKLHFVNAFQFQSTHPVWGATRYRGFLFAIICISIHAPRMGCDKVGDAVKEFNIHFNPRTPYGVRRAEPPRAIRLLCISIHAPRMGCDTYVGAPSTDT